MIELKTIELTAQTTAREVVSELKRQGLMKDNRQTPFQKTEILLYNYNSFQNAIKDKEEKIEEIKAEGLRKKSNSITSFSSNGSFENKSELEKVEEKVDVLTQSIQTTRNFIKVIDAALDVLKDDSYFEVITMKYFEGKTREEIAEYFEVDVSTISRNKNRLINQLQIRLFSDEVIYQIFS